MRTILDHAAALADGRTTSRSLIEASLARIADPSGEGGVSFLAVHVAAARAMADAMDLLRAVGRQPSPYAGIPISVKDLFDIAGERTTAGSRVLADAPPARAHAPALARMLAAGFVPVGRTNMTEFAYSGLGLNPHYGTPRSPWDRASGRIAGGSSSGAAVSVADRMAVAGLGTDTGGSCRVPAAFCGVTGFKPTARRIPLDGIVPLAPSLDSVGVLAPSVGCCAIVDAVMAAQAVVLPAAIPLSRLRLAIPIRIIGDALDQPVAEAFDAAVSRLVAAGAAVEMMDFPALAEIAPATAGGGFAAPEAYAWHRTLLQRGGAAYDPWVRERIAAGATRSVADYLALVAARRAIIARMDAQTVGVDALLMPTCPVVPPRIADIVDDDAYQQINRCVLRNTGLANFLDRCAISLPCHRPGEPPVGLMLMGETSGDARLLAVAAAVEAALAA